MYCKYGAEFVSRLVPEEPRRREKTQIYHSRHRLAIRHEENKQKYPAKTMGKIHTTPPNPQKPLTKGRGFNSSNWSKDLKLNIRKSPQKTLRKPPVPSVKELKPNRKAVSQYCDKIRQNAIKNISAIPVKPKDIYVDTKHGHKNNLPNSGLVPRYRNKNDYGKVPEYIKKRRNETKRAQERYDAFYQEQLEANRLHSLGRDEKSAILSRLKSKWDSLYHQYQGLSVTTDTAPKKNRKEYLENEMSQLERDIGFLERHNTIFIDNM